MLRSFHFGKNQALVKKRLTFYLNLNQMFYLHFWKRNGKIGNTGRAKRTQEKYCPLIYFSKFQGLRLASRQCSMHWWGAVAGLASRKLKRKLMSCSQVKRWVNLLTWLLIGCCVANQELACLLTLLLTMTTTYKFSSLVLVGTHSPDPNVSYLSGSSKTPLN